MANTLLTRQEITFEALEILENNLKVLPNLYRDLDQEFGKKGGKIGDTIFVLKPQRYIGRDGQAYQPESMTMTQVPVTINQQSGVDLEFSTQERYLSIDAFKQRTLMPAVISVANKLDLRCAQTMIANTANHVGTPGTTPGLSGSDAFLIYAQAGQKLDEMGFPLVEGDRTCVITPKMRVGWIDFSKAFFNPTGGLSKQWKTGQVSNALDYTWYVDQNISAQTIGTLGGTPAVTGANQTGTSINLNGLTASVTNWINAGDVFSIAGVYAVNPQSRLTTGSLQQFVAQANASSAGGGTITISFLPAIVPSGQYQNVTNAPADGALVNIYDTAAAGQSALSTVQTPQALCFAKQSFAFVSFPGDVPENVDMGYEDRSSDIGVSIRFARVWDAYRDQWVNRMDVYYGIAPLYMEGNCRISG